MKHSLDAYVRKLVQTFGYEAVAMSVSDHAPTPDLRLVQVDAPPTAKRAADKQDADPSRFSERNMKARILRWCADRGETDRDRLIAWWRTYEPDANHSRIDTVRRRFDELAEIGFLQELDTSGRVRTVCVSLAGARAIDNLNNTGWSKPQ